MDGPLGLGYCPRSGYVLGEAKLEFNNVKKLQLHNPLPETLEPDGFKN